MPVLISQLYIRYYPPIKFCTQVKTRWSELREDEKEQVTQIAYKDVAEGERSTAATERLDLP